MIKKAGQIVPRRFFRAQSRHHQHKITFGVDVEIKGNLISAIAPNNGPVIMVQPYCWRHGQRQMVMAIWPLGVTIEQPYSHRFQPVTV
jgi:hypothetical protein